MKKIVIAPIFNDTHLVKLQIPNIIKSINPDYILYNEGMFPSGPESTTNVDNNFVNKYSYYVKVEMLSFPTHPQRAPNSTGARSYVLSNTIANRENPQISSPFYKDPITILFM